MENHQFQWVNSLFLWPFSLAMLVITRGYISAITLRPFAAIRLVAKWPGPRSAASAAPGTPPHLPGDPGMEQMASMGVLWDLTDLIGFFFEWGVNVTFTIFMGSENIYLNGILR